MSFIIDTNSSLSLGVGGVLQPQSSSAPIDSSSALVDTTALDILEQARQSFGDFGTQVTSSDDEGIIHKKKKRKIVEEDSDEEIQEQESPEVGSELLAPLSSSASIVSSSPSLSVGSVSSESSAPTMVDASTQTDSLEERYFIPAREALFQKIKSEMRRINPTLTDASFESNEWQGKLRMMMVYVAGQNKESAAKLANANSSSTQAGGAT